MFIYSLTCFGRPHAHHQELNNCSSSLWFYRWIMAVAVLLVVVGPVIPVHTSKRHVINLRNCYIWFVELFELYARTLIGK
jgi:hypothetical protein